MIEGWTGREEEKRTWDEARSLLHDSYRTIGVIGEINGWEKWKDILHTTNESLDEGGEGGTIIKVSRR